MKIGILLRIALVASMLIGASTTVAEPPQSPDSAVLAYYCAYNGILEYFI